MDKKEFINNLLKDSVLKVNVKNNPIMILDQEMNILFGNLIFKSIFGKSVIGKKPDFLFIIEEGLKKNFTDNQISDLVVKLNIYHFEISSIEEIIFNIMVYSAGEYKGENIYFCTLLDITKYTKDLLNGTIHTLIKASQLKDNDTGNHVLRINQYSKVLAEYIKSTYSDKYPSVDNAFIETITRVASMHDIGKIGTPDNILMKPGKLSDDEFMIMREHTINGAFILSELAGLMARNIALFHHEKWDGSGYPYGVGGDDIPLCARIVAIADVYDALRMKRSYKESFSQEKTLSIMKESRGTHFDPDLFDIFMEIYDDFEKVFNSLDDEDEYAVLEEMID